MIQDSGYIMDTLKCKDVCGLALSVQYQIANFLQMIQDFLVVRVQSVCNFVIHASPFLNFLATFFPVTGQQL